MSGIQQRRVDRQRKPPRADSIKHNGVSFGNDPDRHCDRIEEHDEHIEYLPVNLARCKDEPVRSDVRSIEAQANNQQAAQINAIADEDDAQLPRPLNGRCCECLPCSRALHYRDAFQQLGMVNCVDFTGRRLNASTSRISSSLRLARDLLSSGSHWVFNNVPFTVLLANERLSEALGRGDPQSQHYASDVKAARAIYDTMRASMSIGVVRFAGFFFSWLLSRNLASLLIPRGQLEMLKLATNERLPIVFVPLHRSHFDYIVLHYALLRCDLMVPYVAAGDNLNIPLIGWFLRRLGAFFIRRRIAPQDTLYRAVMCSYVEELLRARMSMEFYIEGGRSRSGRACPPRTGLLSVVVDSLLGKRVDDVLVVPVAVQYEVVFDQSLVREQLGVQKQRESILHALRSAWRLLCRPLGHVRIDLCQPIRLSEFARRYDTNRPSSDFIPRASCESLRSLTGRFRSAEQFVSPYASVACLPTDEPAANDDRRRVNALVHTLAHHIMFSAMQAQAFMCTHLTAYLLLTEYREGVRLVELANALRDLRTRLAFDELRDCGFSLASRRDALVAVQRSVHLLNSNFVALPSTSNNDAADGLIKLETREKQSPTQTQVPHEETLFVRPNLSLQEAALTLAYYAAPVQSAFAMQSIVITAALSIALERAEFELDRSAYDEPCVVDMAALNERAQQLAALLKNEFCLFPPCTSFDTAFHRVLDRCVVQNLLFEVPADSRLIDKYMSTDRSCKPQDRDQVAVTFGVDDDDEDDDEMIDEVEYSDDDDALGNRKVATQSRAFIALRVDDVSALRNMKALALAVVPLIDAYAIVLEQCATLIGGEESDAALFDRIVEAARSKTWRFTETFSLDTLRRALHTYVCLGVLEKQLNGSTNMYRISEQYAADEHRVAYLRLLHTLCLDKYEC